MTLLCAPAGADLSEANLGSHKILKDAQGDVRFIDVDWKDPEIAGAPLIVSCHNFEETPADLDQVLAWLQERPADLYKIATTAHSTLDALRMLEFVKNHPGVIGLCMGPLGAITRILAPVVGTPLMYACVDDTPNPLGQLSVSTLEEVYHFRALNRATRLYGLIGDPVEASIGHRFHNDAFRKAGENAVYLKMAVRPSELKEFLVYAQKLDFKGLSVTMPLKEAILPYLDEIDPEAQAIGAVNTLVFEDGKIKGFNTDGSGALKALGDVAGKKAVVLGAGGASKAIVYALRQAGAEVVAANRSLKPGYIGLDEVPNQYDILINATPHPLPLEPAKIVPGSTVMDISINETTLLHEARAKGCVCLSGSLMYRHQAEEQQLKWLTPAQLSAVQVLL
jgi:3-dehydroquinate dehydratase/shikimate dehydrogenase